MRESIDFNLRPSGKFMNCSLQKYNYFVYLKASITVTYMYICDYRGHLRQTAVSQFTANLPAVPALIYFALIVALYFINSEPHFCIYNVQTPNNIPCLIIHQHCLTRTYLLRSDLILFCI